MDNIGAVMAAECAAEEDRRFAAGEARNRDIANEKRALVKQCANLPGASKLVFDYVSDTEASLTTLLYAACSDYDDPCQLGLSVKRIVSAMLERIAAAKADQC